MGVYDRLHRDIWNLACILLIVVVTGVLSVGCATEGSYASIEHLTEAAEQGDALAQYNLGFMYAEGQSVPRDYAEARRLYQKAAAQGHAAAQNNLGSLHYYGHDVPQDYAEAVRWFRKPAEQGIADARHSTGGRSNTDPHRRNARSTKRRAKGAHCDRRKRDERCYTKPFHGHDGGSPHC